MDPNLRVEAAMTRTCASLQGIYDVWYHGDMFLTDSEKATLRTHLNNFGESYHVCAGLSQAAGWLLFPVKPKAHYLSHMAEQSDLINPVMVQNYMEEGLVGRVCKIWASSVSGPWRSVVTHTVLRKYNMVLWVEHEAL